MPDDRRASTVVFPDYTDAHDPLRLFCSYFSIFSDAPTRFGYGADEGAL